VKFVFLSGVFLMHLIFRHAEIGAAEALLGDLLLIWRLAIAIARHMSLLLENLVRVIVELL